MGHEEGEQGRSGDRVGGGLGHDVDLVTLEIWNWTTNDKSRLKQTTSSERR